MRVFRTPLPPALHAGNPLSNWMYVYQQTIQSVSCQNFSQLYAPCHVNRKHVGSMSRSQSQIKSFAMSRGFIGTYDVGDKIVLGGGHATNGLGDP